MTELREEAKNQLGECIDLLDSLYHAMALPMPAQFHIDIVKSALPKLVQQMQEAYAASFGENPWSTR